MLLKSRNSCCNIVQIKICKKLYEDIKNKVSPIELLSCHDTLLRIAVVLYKSMVFNLNISQKQLKFNLKFSKFLFNFARIEK